ncbi:hypothetical protein B0H11DRAFT_1910520 [Mycena galericulata]|nr:hypothetical protein B0H11DRAFT_1910520 [Mycena galericulata]
MSTSGQVATGVKSSEWKKAQRLFLESRVARRERRRVENKEKQVRNTAKASQRVQGVTGQTSTTDEALENDSDDEFEVQDPVTPTVAAGATSTLGSQSDADAILKIMKNLDPKSQTMFLSLMTGMQSTSSASATLTPTPAPEAAAAPIPGIFNASIVRPATSDGNTRIPFFARILELAVAGIYLELSIFTNDTIHDMFVNQNSLAYQPQKRTIVGADGNHVKIYTINPSIFADQTSLSHTRFNEAHANYRRWYIVQFKLGCLSYASNWAVAPDGAF